MGVLRPSTLLRYCGQVFLFPAGSLPAIYFPCWCRWSITNICFRRIVWKAIDECWIVQVESLRWRHRSVSEFRQVGQFHSVVRTSYSCTAFPIFAGIFSIGGFFSMSVPYQHMCILSVSIAPLFCQYCWNVDVLVDRCLSFYPFSFGHCFVCSSSIYGF